MFAVIKTGGKQYKVQEGDVLEVEKLHKDKGQKVTFDKVLLIDEGGKTLIGTPFIENAQVKAEIIENFKDKKIIVFKKKRRKQYKKKRGHRQDLTRVKIEKITSTEKSAAVKKPAEAVKEKKEMAPPKKRAEVDKVKTKAVKKPDPEKEEKKGEKEEPKTQKKAEAKKAEKPKVKAPAKKKTTVNGAAKDKKQS